MTAIDVDFDIVAEAGLLHIPPSTPYVAVALAELRVEFATVAESTGYESDRELAIMRRFTGWPKGVA